MKRIGGVAITVESLATSFQLLIEHDTVISLKNVDVVLDGALGDYRLIGLAQCCIALIHEIVDGEFAEPVSEAAVQHLIS